MRLIADESCDFGIVRNLRTAQHDVVSIADIFPGATDEQVIEIASSQQRLLITEDKDFGQLVFAAAKESSGVLMVRYPALARSALIDVILRLLSQRGDTLYGCFVVVEPGRIRLNRLP